MANFGGETAKAIERWRKNIVAKSLLKAKRGRKSKLNHLRKRSGNLETNTSTKMSDPVAVRKAVSDAILEDSQTSSLLDNPVFNREELLQGIEAEVLETINRLIEEEEELLEESKANDVSELLNQSDQFEASFLDSIIDK